MTCRIDPRRTEKGLLLYISGRLEANDLKLVRAALEGSHVVAIELSEVELVGREAVGLSSEVEAEGIELRGCPPYIREWITNERTSG
jgi:hypothetical protein